jgi:hypothetical protein
MLRRFESNGPRGSEEGKTCGGEERKNLRGWRASDDERKAGGGGGGGTKLRVWHRCSISRVCSEGYLIEFLVAGKHGGAIGIIAQSADHRDGGGDYVGLKNRQNVRRVRGAAAWGGSA